jgi:hypothetical protein
MTHVKKKTTTGCEGNAVVNHRVFALRGADVA